VTGRLAVLAAAALLVGCGGGGTTIYAKQATEACLQKLALHPAPVPETADFVANSAKGGAFAVQLADNRVTVSFGDSMADADNIDLAYRRFADPKVGVDDVLRRQGNAVMLWHVHPQDDDLATLTRCLKK
jgi:hypothetical protein